MSTEIQNSEAFAPVPDKTNPFAPDFNCRMNGIINREAIRAVASPVLQAGAVAITIAAADAAPAMAKGLQDVADISSPYANIITNLAVGGATSATLAGIEYVQNPGDRVQIIGNAAIGLFVGFETSDAIQLGSNFVKDAKSDNLDRNFLLGYFDMAKIALYPLLAPAIKYIIETKKDTASQAVTKVASEVENRVFGTPEERQKAEVDRYINGLPEVFKNLRNLSQSKKTNAENYLMKGGFSEVDKENTLKSLSKRNPAYQFIKNAKNIRYIYSNGNTLLVCNKNYEVKILSMEQEQQ